MRLVIGMVALWLAVGTSALAQKVGEVPKVVPSMSAPRGEVLESVSGAGQPYWYRLPKKLDERRPPNLVFMLHGTGMPWGWAFWNYPIESGQFRGDDIVVAPEGVTPGNGTSFNFVQNNKDGDQIADLIKTFRKEFPIGKVYLYGHSQGAFFCYWFAGEYTELVDGIVAHAGNVLSVNHNKLAKQKVAIGILHGKADAVVPVDCAYRTEKIYQEQGYEKVKLTVVEGLNEQTGHWPLPVQVAEMFEWLDQVSSSSPGETLAVAWSELGKESPDLAVVADAVGRTPDLLKKYKGEEEDLLAQRLALLQQFLADVEAAHTQELLQHIGPKPGDEYQPWIAHFLVVEPAFAGSKNWQKEMKPVLTAEKAHDKTVGKAIDRLNKRVDKKAVEDAVEALESGPLAPGYSLLVTLVGEQVESPPKGLDAVVLDRYRALLESRQGLAEQGRQKAHEITGARAQALRTEHAALFGEE